LAGVDRTSENEGASLHHWANGHVSDGARWAATYSKLILALGGDRWDFACMTRGRWIYKISCSTDAPGQWVLCIDFEKFAAELQAKGRSSQNGVARSWSVRARQSRGQSTDLRRQTMSIHFQRGDHAGKLFASPESGISHRRLVRRRYETGETMLQEHAFPSLCKRIVRPMAKFLRSLKHQENSLYTRSK